MRSLLLADPSFLGEIEGCYTENQLIFTFSDEKKVKTNVWYKAQKMPELHVQGLSLYKSDMLMIRDEAYRTFKGYYEINGGYDYWVDIHGNEIKDVYEWMKCPIARSNTMKPPTDLRS